MSLLSLPVDQLAGASLGLYRVEQLLGCGKLNAIYTARLQEQDSEGMLTVFIIPDQFSPQAREQFMSRFQQEMSLLRQLQHQYILPVYDYGEQYGYPYFVTPLVTSGSLAKALKQQTRYSPAQALEILKQVAEGLDFAHSAGVVHGSLKPANILLDDEQKVLIAGFGLVRMLAMRGIGHLDQPYAHLFSIAGTFLGAPEYIAPEVVEGAPGDARSDVYALGIMLFELLSGRPPFSGSDPLTIAMQHVQQSVPPLQEVCPDVPPALDLVLQQALARDPAQRFSSAGKLARSFERVLQLLELAQNPPPTAIHSAAVMGDAVTLPPTINWFEEEMPPGNRQDITQAAYKDDASQTSRPEAPAAPDNTQTFDPFAWWSITSIPTPKMPEAGTFNQGATSTRSPAHRRRTPDKMRRRTVALLATGGVIVVGALGAGGLSLAHLLKHSPGQTGTDMRTRTPTTGPASANTQATQPQNTPASTATSAPTSTPTAQQKQTQPTPAASPTPAMQQPTPTPMPGHTGTVIGSTSQGVNTARLFTNPADGRGSWLIHLPGGSFVAFERACTHQGVAVNYNAGSGKLVCPAHGAIFDPANGARVVQGPANRPLASVPIHVNGDGTITTG
jgi:serine/threonine protein kinase/nitrite reductase/ring-hydroxylating ferredoxin subunit